MEEAMRKLKEAVNQYYESWLRNDEEETQCRYRNNMFERLKDIKELE